MLNTRWFYILRVISLKVRTACNFYKLIRTEFFKHDSKEQQAANNFLFRHEPPSYNEECVVSKVGALRIKIC